jgi:putative FmdB family regulatory protein
MPTYEYECKACGQTCDIFQSITDKPKKKCPACGRRSLERRIGAGAGIIFRGSGFYETDYRSESYKSEARKEKNGDASPSKPSESSGAAKKGASDTKKDSGSGDRMKAAG